MTDDGQEQSANKARPMSAATVAPVKLSGVDTNHVVLTAGARCSFAVPSASRRLHCSVHITRVHGTSTRPVFTSGQKISVYKMTLHGPWIR